VTLKETSSSLRGAATVDVATAGNGASRLPGGLAGDDPTGEGRRPGADLAGEGSVFSDRVRRLGLIWVGIALVITAVVSTVIRTPQGFLVLMPLTSALFTVPAIVVGAIAVRRMVTPFRKFWRWYLGANIALYIVGSAIVGYAVRPRTVYEIVAMLGLTGVVVCDAFAIDHVLRARAGARSRSVDMVESGLAIVLVVAPVVVIYGDEMRRSPYAWFAMFSIVCLVVFTSAAWCAVVLFLRSPPGRRRSESLCVALWVAAVLDSVVQTEQLISGFMLPNPPVLVLNGVCMGLLLLMPLNTPHRLAQGQERLPPQAQIRTGKVIAAITLAALPVLGAAVLVAGRTATAVHLAGLGLAAVVGLSAIRQLLTFAETRRLYGEVERSAEDRRALLAAVLESMNADRQRVAMQLHQQASSSYAALASLVPQDGGGPRTASARRPGVVEGPSQEAWAARLRPIPAVPVSHLLTERMAAQAESLRELIGAIRPLATSEGAGLAPILQAYVDSLDDAAPPAVTRVEVAADLVLDWITETVALRVVQEAVHNTCRHAEASELRITLAVEDGVAVVRVVDDGIGFDPAVAGVESGIATMRRFVDFCGGELAIHSRRGEGTVVEARLGGRPPERPQPPRLRPVP
jgi:signal transduction histidine kinase